MITKQVLVMLFATTLMITMVVPNVIVNAAETQLETSEFDGGMVIMGEPDFWNPDYEITGSGIESDPYLIEGHFIDMTMWDGSAIYISVPNVHVVIQGCALTGMNSGSGIEIQGMSNVTIIGCSIDTFVEYSDIYGIRIQSSRDIHIESVSVLGAFTTSILIENAIDNVDIYDCDIHNTVADGIDITGITGSTGHSVKECDVTGNNGIGILFGIGTFEIENNTIYDTHPYWALAMTSTINSKVCFNDIQNCGRGLLFQSTSNLQVFNNTVQNCDVGIYVDGSQYDHVFWNRFIDNTQQYIFSSAHPYWWNLTYYDGGGNYWSDYTGPDIYSGPGQNETGRDYIGDEPYDIGTITDYYPLINASGWVNLTIPKVVNYNVTDDYVELFFYESMNTTSNGTVKVNGTNQTYMWVNATNIYVNITNLTLNQSHILNMTGFENNDGVEMEEYETLFMTNPPETLPTEPDPEPEEEPLTMWQVLYLMLTGLLALLILILVIKKIVEAFQGMDGLGKKK